MRKEISGVCEAVQIDTRLTANSVGRRAGSVEYEAGRVSPFEELIPRSICEAGELGGCYGADRYIDIKPVTP
jgi:hypothetical protein